LWPGSSAQNVNPAEEKGVARSRKAQQGRTHAVFVYGTLKRGFPNHFFLRNARFAGRARTVDSYALYLDEYPGVYPGQQVSPIIGEVYRVDRAMLGRIDVLEDHPELYRREECDVRLDSGEVIRAFIYFYPRAGGRLIESGEFVLA
jgi:Uncharacterized conserved protein